MEVWRPDRNGGDSRNVLANLDDWVLGRQADVVHVNCGLHDLKFLPDSGYQVPLDQYAEGLRKIVARIEGESNARLIWATTTPVIDEWHQNAKPFERHEADVRRYNDAALGIMREHGIEVNDLHQVIRQAGPERMLKPDGVHMNERGSELLAQAVASAIMSAAEWERRQPNAERERQ